MNSGGVPSLPDTRPRCNPFRQLPLRPAESSLAMGAAFLQHGSPAERLGGLDENATAI